MKGERHDKADFIFDCLRGAISGLELRRTGETEDTAGRNAPAVDPWGDQSTVEKTLILGHIILEMPQNGPPVNQVYYGTNDRTRKYIDVYSNATMAREALRRSLLDRFGNDGPKTFQIASYHDQPMTAQELEGLFYRDANIGDPFPKQLPKLEIRIDGDKAAIRDPQQPAGILHAVRRNGQWKIELPDFGKALDFELTLAPAYEAGTSLERDLAKEIAEGKYKSADEAFAEFTERQKRVQSMFDELRPKLDQIVSAATRPGN